MLLRMPEAHRLADRDLRPSCDRSFMGSLVSRSAGADRRLLRAENYLSLVGLVIVVLGGIAVSSVTRVFGARRSSIAVMKCVEAPAGRFCRCSPGARAWALGSLAGVASRLSPSWRFPRLNQIGTLTAPHFVVGGVQDWCQRAASLPLDVPLLEVRR
jgi:hypothetical protein